jgi:hypothetical protein
MIYKTVSIENVIGRVIRNTKLTDTSAIQDIYEWIPEAMELLETKQELEPISKPVVIKFHQCRVPSGLSYIEAVEYKGHRLNYSEQIKVVEPREELTATVFQSVPELWTNPATGNQVQQFTLQQVKQLPIDHENYYYVKPNYLCTSMREANLILHYKAVPLDPNGFPFIPDNGNYKEAVFWYVRGKLIGSGQLEDRANSEDSCLRKFELYGGRAINEITYPSIDKMETIRANQLQFGIAENYWSNFNRV